MKLLEDGIITSKKGEFKMYFFEKVTINGTTHINIDSLKMQLLSMYWDDPIIMREIIDLETMEDIYAELCYPKLGEALRMETVIITSKN